MFLGCTQKEDPPGTLLVVAEGKGAYEIFHMQETENSQLISQGMGVFNEPKLVPPGQYVLLADCSYKVVTLYPNQITREVVHQVEFLPPQGRGERELFWVQCSRYPQIHAVQEIRNRFALQVFGGKRDILAGMSSLTFSLEGEAPSHLRFQLSALRVVAERNEASYGEIPYFVSQVQKGVSLTQEQKTNHWQFLLPGIYSVTMNGTERVVELLDNHTYELSSALIRFEAPHLDQAGYTKITGSPPFVFIEDQFPFSVNTDILILSGSLRYRLDGSRKTDTLTVGPGEQKKIELQTVFVESGCASWDLECAGQRKVQLYDEGSAYPFLDSVSDVPIMYQGDSVLLGVEGARGLLYRLPKKEPHLQLKMGKLKVIPQPLFQLGYMTDLLRLEPGQSTVQSGVSHDISYEKPTTFSLIVGTYRLARYTNGPNNFRASLEQNLTVLFGKETVKVMPYYLPLSKYQKVAGKFEEWMNPRQSIDSYFLHRF